MFHWHALFLLLSITVLPKIIETLGSILLCIYRLPSIPSTGEVTLDVFPLRHCSQMFSDLVLLFQPQLRLVIELEQRKPEPCFLRISASLLLWVTFSFGPGHFHAPVAFQQAERRLANVCGGKQLYLHSPVKVDQEEIQHVTRTWLPYALP